MKKSIVSIILALASIVFAAAQSTNPLNYGGKMYVESIDVISTPRYVSYEDHAILSKDMSIPSMEIQKCILDFENNTVTVGETVMKIKVNATKKYTEHEHWIVVIYMDLVDEGDKAELVWPEFGKPYFQQISKADSGIKIARMILSRKPVVADPGDAMMQLLQGLGTM